MKKIKLTTRNIRSHPFTAVIVFVILFSICAAVTLDVAAPHYSDKITVEALGVKNELSGGADIGISSIRIGLGSMDLSKVNNWGFLDNSLTWGFRETRSFEITAPIYSKIKITFRKNVWAGLVRITGRGIDETKDLYSVSDTEETFVIDARSPMTILSRMWYVALILFAELILLLLLCMLELGPMKSGKTWSLASCVHDFFIYKPVTVVRLFIMALALVVMWKYAGVVSLWSDDLTTIEYVANWRTLKQNIDSVLYEARFNPPLFYVLAFIWLRIAPFGTAYIKLLNILICALGMWFCGSAARKIGGDRAAVFATIFAATSYFVVNYAAYTFRCFGMTFLLCALLILAYYRRLTKPEKVSSHILYGLVMALLLYTNYLCGLIVAVLGLCDFCLFVRKKVKIYCVFSYVGAAVAFAPLMLYVLKDLIESHANFWPPVPTLSSLMATTNLIFSGNMLMLFVFAVTALMLLNKAGEREALGISQEKLWLMRSLVITAAFVLGFDFVYSRYINPQGSIFYARYFICIVPAVVVASAVGVDWLLTLLLEGKSDAAKRILAASLMTVCLLSAGIKEIDELIRFPGFVDSRIDRAVDWIYSHPDSTSDNALVVMSIGGGASGLPYYATHGGERENLNFGWLTEDNWGNYTKVYVFTNADVITDDTVRLLSEHYEEIERNDYLYCIVYLQK